MGYPGLTYIGSGKISGLYGLNETIHDQKSIGLQHLFVDNYEHDLIYSANSVLKADHICYYGDRIKARAGHPVKERSHRTYCQDGFVFVDEFKYEYFEKIDRVYCSGDYQLVFSCEVINRSRKTRDIDLSAFLVTTSGKMDLSLQDGRVRTVLKDYSMDLTCFDQDLTYRVSLESPSGFMYHGIQDLLFNDNLWEGEPRQYFGSVALSATKQVTLEPEASYQLTWMLDFTQHKEQRQMLDTINSDPIRMRSRAREYWDEWLTSTSHEIDDKMKANLIALKAVNMQGFIPADLTGHYFASSDIAFYVRDAIHGAKAFMFCGFFDECRQVIEVIMNLQRKENHELFQRYNSRLIPDEGANNNVFSQIDVIGYLLSIVADYYQLTGQLIIDLDDLMKEVRILDKIQTKKGLYGPEGGVNEGVYGPAFITSTNIFIAAGLKRLGDLMEVVGGSQTDRSIINDKLTVLNQGIKATFLDDGYYAYGYVDYHDQIIKRYDTPQLFGAGLGYPVDDMYKQNFVTLTKISTYYGYGYGYSEQQYHDGPWLFNTCYAAQNAYIFGMTDLYEQIIEWIENHKNDYGLLPEAVDARNESASFINPLMWANAEYLCAKQAHLIKAIREGERYDSKGN